jgi:hypothetical protein
MKTALLAAALMTLGSSAFADGFICDNAAGNLRFKVYHQTQPEMGTRKAAILIASNPALADGNKTIATFSSNNALLASQSAVYTADVDLRYKTSNNENKNIGGAKLGDLDSIILNVNYSFSNPVPAGTSVDAELTLVRRAGSGSDVRMPMNCTRYLKGE